MKDLQPVSHWKLGTDLDFPMVTFICPSCAKASTLWRGFGEDRGTRKIAADGVVSPSVVCPHKGCSYHEFVRLLGWSGGERA